MYEVSSIWSFPLFLKTIPIDKSTSFISETFWNFTLNSADGFARTFVKQTFYFKIFLKLGGLTSWHQWFHVCFFLHNNVIIFLIFDNKLLNKKNDKHFSSCNYSLFLLMGILTFVIDSKYIKMAGLNDFYQTSSFPDSFLGFTKRNHNVFLWLLWRHRFLYNSIINC